MTWVEDLAPFYGSDCEEFRAVGWLAQGQPFPTGEVSESVFEKLCQLLQNPWNPAYPAGYHLCELCRFSGGGGVNYFKDYAVSGRSAADVYVPAQGVVYVAPSSITHYIDAHWYQPPEEFCEAVLNCPPMRSVSYFQALLNNGNRELIKDWLRHGHDFGTTGSSHL